MMSQHPDNSDRFLNLLTDNSLKGILEKMPVNLASQTTLIWVKLAMQMASKPDKLKILLMTHGNGVVTGKDMSDYIMQIWEDLRMGSPSAPVSDDNHSRAVPMPSLSIKSEVGNFDDLLLQDEQIGILPSNPIASSPTPGPSRSPTGGDMFVAAFTDSNENDEHYAVNDQELDKVSPTPNDDFDAFELRPLRVTNLRPRRISVTSTSSSDNEETRDESDCSERSLAPAPPKKMTNRKRIKRVLSSSSFASEPDVQKFVLRNETRLLKKAKGANAKVKRISHKRIVKMATPISNIKRCPLKLAEKKARSAPKVNMFFCWKCPASFKYKGNLSRHMNEVHSKPIIYKCSDCEAMFTRKRSLVGHYKALHAENRTPYTCEVCGTIFFVRQTYHKHTKKCY